MATATQESWPLVKWADAAQVAAEMKADLPLPVDEGTAPQGYFEKLTAAGHAADAVAFLAHALPRYECVTWGARSLIETGAVATRDPLMTAVLRWIDSPEDTLRRAVQALAEHEDAASPTVLLAHAVWLSGGSISDPELPAVQPPSHVCAKLVAGALLQAAYGGSDPAATLQAYLGIGREIAAGRSGR